MIIRPTGPVARAASPESILADGLHALQPFSRVSRRLRADLAELSSVAQAPAGKKVRVEASLFMVLDGAVGVMSPDAERAGDRPIELAPGDVFWPVPPLEAADIPVGFQALGANARILSLDLPVLRRARQASFSLDRALLFSSLVKDAGRVEADPNLHFMWVTADPDAALGADVLAELIASGIASQFGEPTAIVRDLDGRARIDICSDSAVLTPFRAPAPLSISELIGSIVPAVLRDHLRDVAPERRIGHVLVVNPDASDPWPRRFAIDSFHRVVLACGSLPDRYPAELGDFVRPGAKKTGSERWLFSSLICLHVLDRRTATPSGRMGTAATPRRTRFRTRKVVGELDPTQDPARAASAAAIWRDSLELTIDVRRVHDAAASLARDRPARPSLPTALGASDGGARDFGLRCARAVTNRRVGIGLSGGGASSYRLVPLLRKLEQLAVPIDVVCGVSGGAGAGAFYCEAGREGLERYVGQGPTLAAGLLLFPFWSKPVEYLWDWQLGGACVDRTAIPFVPLTTKLCNGAPPESHAIVGGTLGQAVRASGAMPLLFGPVEYEGIRYADGGCSVLVPAEVLKDFGADLVFAFNTVPGPSRGRPHTGWPWLDRLLDRTPIGSLRDFVVAFGFLLQQSSRAFGRDAHRFFEPIPERLSLLEALQFYDARAIVDESREEMEGLAASCADAWRDLIRLSPFA